MTIPCPVLPVLSRRSLPAKTPMAIPLREAGGIQTTSTASQPRARTATGPSIASRSKQGGGPSVRPSQQHSSLALRLDRERFAAPECVCTVGGEKTRQLCGPGFWRARTRLAASTLAVCRPASTGRLDWEPLEGAWGGGGRAAHDPSIGPLVKWGRRYFKLRRCFINAGLSTPSALDPCYHRWSCPPARPPPASASASQENHLLFWKPTTYEPHPIRPVASPSRARREH